MQALRDAGILLVVITLLISVRISPVDRAVDATDPGSLHPQTDAAVVALPLPAAFAGVSAGIAADAPIEIGTPVRWILTHETELDMAGIEVETAQKCTQVLLRVRSLIESGESERAILFEAKRIAKEASCPSA